MEDNVDSIIADVMPVKPKSQENVDEIIASVAPTPKQDDSIKEVDEIIASLGMPKKKAPVTQQFGNVNPSIEVHSGGVNYGTDFGYKYGDEVKAPQGEWIVEDSYSGDTQPGYIGNTSNSGYGNSIKLRNPKTGETIRLSHLSTNFTKLGMMIEGGSLLGLVGNTGNVTGNGGQSGAHLDVEYTDPSGQYADITKTPYSY